MPTITLRNASGSDAGTVDLDDEIFGIEPNVAVMHQVVTAQLAARRSGTQSPRPVPRSVAAVPSPGSRRAPAVPAPGSIRAPQWRGGGVALGPKPRSYEQRTPKKMKRLALRSALSDRAAENKVIVVDDWGFQTPRRRTPSPRWRARRQRPILLVCSVNDETTWKSFRNVPRST